MIRWRRGTVVSLGREWRGCLGLTVDVAAEPLASPGMPVVVADLHSSLPAVVAGVLADRPEARIAYVMTDGGALPLWFSRTVAALGDVLCGSVTVGQAYGGDLEAVTTHSGL